MPRVPEVGQSVGKKRETRPGPAVKWILLGPALPRIDESSKGFLQCPHVSGIVAIYYLRFRQISMSPRSIVVLNAPSEISKKNNL